MEASCFLAVIITWISWKSTLSFTENYYSGGLNFVKISQKKKKIGNLSFGFDNKPVYYSQYFRSGIISVNDLHFDIDNLTSFNRIAKEIDGSNFLTWTGLRNSVPPNLRQLHSSSTVDSRSTVKPAFKHSKCVFDVTKTKSKHYYSLLIGAKARLPNNSINLKREFNLTEEQLGKFYLLPHTVTSEPYLKAFQYKVLNSILYTNDKLYKIGYINRL